MLDLRDDFKNFLSFIMYKNLGFIYSCLMMLISQRKKNWFTLAEIVVICTLFSIIIVWVIVAINRAFVFIDNTRLAVRATNFAREGVEIMYNIRDTNWRRHSWDRDKYWFNTWEMNWINCKSENKDFEDKIYILKKWENCGDEYNYATEESDLLYDDETFWNTNSDSKRSDAKISIDGDYAYASKDEDGNRDIGTGDINELLWDTEFYRLVKVYGIYCKGNNSNSDSDTCKNNNTGPKEMRFCVKVFYRSANWKHSKELCSIMTNFME